MCYYGEIYDSTSVFLKYFPPRNTTIITLLAMNISLVNLLERFKSTYAKIGGNIRIFASTHMRHVSAIFEVGFKVWDVKWVSLNEGFIPIYSSSGIRIRWYISKSLCLNNKFVSIVYNYYWPRFFKKRVTFRCIETINIPQSRLRK
jgi:hypothetical protein